MKHSPSRIVLAVTASGFAAALAMLTLVFTVLTHAPQWATGLGGTGLFLILSAGGFLVERTIATWSRRHDTPHRDRAGPPPPP